MKSPAKTHEWSSWILQGYILVWRVDWTLGSLALLWMSALIAGLWGLPKFHELRAAQQQRLLQLQKIEGAPPVGAPRSSGNERLESFYATLGDVRHPEQQFRTLFDYATQVSLNLNRAEYKWDDDPSGHYRTYQMILPVKGSYAAIRQFCEKTLLTFPYVSLDELDFKRDAIGNPMLDAKLRLTFYLTDKPAEDKNASSAEVAKP